MLETLDDEHVMCTLVRAEPPPVVGPKILPADYLTFDSRHFPTLLSESMHTCHQKVLAFATSEKRSHVMQGPFETVFVTSDIHADLAQFIQMLRATGLIVDGGGTVYDRVWTAKWNPDAQSTLLVICGDLVDGKRNDGEVDDPLGSFEFLLHVLLFNLRIEARAVQSDVRFTLGNHDTNGVTAPRPGFATHYATEGHVAFAPRFEEGKGEAARIAMLRPFYMCSPYLLLRLGRAVFVHAGFLETGSTADLFAPAVAIQDRMDAEQDVTNVLKHTFEASKGDQDNVVWARGYAENDPCRYIASYASIDFIAVGHCIVHDKRSYPALAATYAAQCSASEMIDKTDSTEGCVISHDCRKAVPEGGPIIAMVDTGSSRCFRHEGARATSLARPVGMILLSKVRKGHSLGEVDGYFIHRIRVDQTSYAVIDEKGRHAYV